MLEHNLRVVHLTSAHQRYDIRIFIKECQSLADNGYQVSLVVADGKGDEEKNGISIYDVGESLNRLNRMLKTTRQIYQSALDLDADIYHLHDPELIPIGLKLLKRGKKVVFDAHEDLPKQVLSKPYLKKWQVQPLSWMIQKFESYTLSSFSGVIAATPGIYGKFRKINNNTSNVNNFPILGELGDGVRDVEWKIKKPRICYVGGIAQIRGIEQLVQAMSLCGDVKLDLVGDFSEEVIYKNVKSKIGWKKVMERGFLGRDAVRQIVQESMAGIVTFLPVPNHIDAQPNKMFEYMSAGLPIITSNFPLWREIVEGNRCGICVDPVNPKEIAEAIDYLVDHPQEAQKMGDNGKKAVLERYNWGIEEKKLLMFYKEIAK